MIQTYSLKTAGSKQLTPNFKVREFSCLDGTDKILIDDKLVALLQKIRDHFGAALVISSGYRTLSHNQAVGGSPNSQHLLGMAADITVAGAAPLAVAQCAESFSAGGIGLYTRKQFVHVDTRASKTRWQDDGNGQYAVSGWGGAPTIVNGPVQPLTVFVNEQPRQLESVLAEGVNYVNLRQFAAALGAEVAWDEVNRRILITIPAGR